METQVSVQRVVDGDTSETSSKGWKPDLQIETVLMRSLPKLPLRDGNAYTFVRPGEVCRSSETSSKGWKLASRYRSTIGQ